MSDYDRFTAQTKARQWLAVENTLTRMTLRRKAYERNGVITPGMPDTIGEAVDTMLAFEDNLCRIRNVLKREFGQLCEDHPLRPWVDVIHGIGLSVLLLDALLPRAIWVFDTVSGLWKCCGLHPDGAKKRVHGKKIDYAPYRKAIAIARIVDPIVKSGGPYREVYDTRKALLSERHPPMPVEGCEFCQMAGEADKAERKQHEYERERTGFRHECAQNGGIHYTKGHLDNDAKRITAKAVLRDAWRVGNCHPPLVGTVPW